MDWRSRESQIDDPEHTRVAAFYQNNIRLSGSSFPSLGWYNPQTQRVRFEVFMLLGALQGSTVLDAGCGLGDFYAFLLEKHSNDLCYVGLDLMPQFIARAAERFAADSRARFVPQSWEQWQSPVDWIFSSGAFNLGQPEPYAYVRKHLLHFLTLARRGMAVNFLSNSTTATQRDPNFFYYDPAEILRLALDLTPHVVLHHDYLPNDFTVFLYPSF